MTTMFSPDLLDRRALALVRLVDVAGRPVPGPVHVEGDGVVCAAKGQGRIAILAAAGFQAHIVAFQAAPSSPQIQTKHVQLDLTPVDRDVAARRFDLQLPRDADPTHQDRAASLFRSVDIEMLPSPSASGVGSTCTLRVTVKRKDDGRLVENALVRAQSDNGQLAARALTDARGEACLIFPSLPLAFPAGNASLQPETPARVVVTVDAAARFHRPEEVAAAAATAALRRTGHADPDAIGSADADFASGVAVGLAAGRQPSLTIQWEQP